MPTASAPLSEATAEFGRRVRARRTELGLSQEALADIAQLHWTFVGQVERGRRNLTLHNILKLAAALQIDPAELIRGVPAPRQ
jgi:transcriptional regulator with XRE-family HTH domain